MSTDISNLAYSLRVASAKLTHPFGLGHSQQLIAAALGYQSLAAYQANAEECKVIDNGVHILLDTSLLMSRANGLSIQINQSELLDLIVDIFRSKLPLTRLYGAASEFSDELNEIVVQHVINDEVVSSQTAMTNHDGFQEVYFQVEFSLDDLPSIGESMELPLTGHVNMKQDIERVYYGHHIDVDVLISAERLGQTILGSPVINVTSAKLDFGWSSDNEDNEEPRVSMAQALADELGLDLADAEQLVEVEEMPLDGMSGEMIFSYLLDFNDVAPPDVAAKILANHGKLEIEVSINFFDRVQRSFD